MSLEAFFDEEDQSPKWGNPVEVERRNRIRLSVWAYAYEFHNTILVSDEEFDKLALKINPSAKTGNAKLDKFFATDFDPSTGMWVHKHPDLKRLRQTYLRVKEYYSINIVE